MQRGVRKSSAGALSSERYAASPHSGISFSSVRRVARGNFQQPVVGDALARAEIGVPAKKARRDLLAHVAHPRLQCKASDIKDKTQREVDRERIAGAWTD